MKYAAGLACCVLLVGCAAEPATPEASHPTQAPATEPAPSDSPSDQEAEPQDWEPAGMAKVAYGDETRALANARVICETDGSRISLTVDLPDEVNTGYWATLWSTEAGVDVLDVGIGYAHTTPIGDPALPHSWTQGGAGAFTASNAGQAWVVAGYFDHEAGRIPARLELTCP